VTAAAQLLPMVGVKVGVQSRCPPPSTLKIDLRQELDRIRSAVARIEQQLAEQDGDAPPSRLADDAIVDQRCVPAPPDLFLRLARNGAFPSRKVGKRVVAQWGDVRRALLSGPALSKAPGRQEAGAQRDDGLDSLRECMGLVSKGQ
jgi:hypothetical protein